MLHLMMYIILKFHMRYMKYIERYDAFYSAGGIKSKFFRKTIMQMIFLFSLSGGEEENEIISLYLHSGYSKW